MIAPPSSRRISVRLLCHLQGRAAEPTQPAAAPPAAPSPPGSKGTETQPRQQPWRSGREEPMKYGWRSALSCQAPSSNWLPVPARGPGPSPGSAWPGMLFPLHHPLFPAVGAVRDLRWEMRNYPLQVPQPPSPPSAGL